MTLHLRVVAHSEVGLVRKNNQDSGYASPRLLVVADGMGGAAAGDLASAVAIDVIKQLDTPAVAEAASPEGSTDDGTEETIVVAGTSGAATEQGAAGRNPLLSRFADAIDEANARIADLVADDYTLEGMGTTVTGALFDGDRRLALAHIGDSRAYLLRGGRLERLTHDHSWVQSLVDDGKISPEEAAFHPHRSLLLKVLNGQPANDPDLTTVELQPEDRVLFCSDGLCGMVDDDEIAGLVAIADLDTAVAGLVDAALSAGGIDNITVILAEALPDPESAGTARSGARVEDEDTAIRGAVPAVAGTVLGAAVVRDIPAVARRSAPAPGLPQHDDPDRDAPGTAATRSPTTPAPTDDESRYSPGPPAKRPFVRTLLVGLAVLLVAAAGLGAGYAWTRTQYFVGAADGQVAIYTGLPDGIPGLSLSQVYEVQNLPVSTLPPYYQAQVTAGIEVSSLEAARATVGQLEQAAARCAEPPASPSAKPSASPSAKPSASPSVKPSAGPSSTTSAKPRPTASISVTPSPRGTAGSVAPTPSPTPSPAPGEC
ncbi:MAG TPA: protein phosphatase 2C domain-containing protein [Microlunatus sp.]|nr:protein phosphatase 2C domain-containing protein [Microlunatus sp.]